MKKLKNLENSLWKAIIISIVFGFIVAVVLSHFILAFYIVTNNNVEIIEKQIDKEPNKSIKDGY